MDVWMHGFSPASTQRAGHKADPGAKPLPWQASPGLGITSGEGAPPGSPRPPLAPPPSWPARRRLLGNVVRACARRAAGAGPTLLGCGALGCFGRPPTPAPSPAARSPGPDFLLRRPRSLTERVLPPPCRKSGAETESGMAGQVRQARTAPREPGPRRQPGRTDDRLGRACPVRRCAGLEGGGRAWDPLTLAGRGAWGVGVRRIWCREVQDLGPLLFPSPRPLRVRDLEPELHLWKLLWVKPHTVLAWLLKIILGAMGMEAQGERVNLGTFLLGRILGSRLGEGMNRAPGF